jgi:hypothetical protein
VLNGHQLLNRLSFANRCYREKMATQGTGRQLDHDAAAKESPSPGNPPVSASAESIRARQFDVATLLATLALIVAVAQLPAWRAAFSSISVFAFAALIFAFRYGRGRWKVPVCAILGFISLAASVMVYLQPALTKKSTAHPLPSRPPSETPAPPPVAIDALLAGDCIRGDDLHLDDGDAEWPSNTGIAPCDESHDGEVFLAADPWVINSAFPGQNSVDKLARERCNDAFRFYVGIELSRSVLHQVYKTPTADTWAEDDRHIFCVAYDPAGKLTSTVRRLNR